MSEPLSEQKRCVVPHLPEHLCITFIGMAGAGKTTVGRLVARALDWAFADSDHIIEDVEFVNFKVAVTINTSHRTALSSSPHRGHSSFGRGLDGVGQHLDVQVVLLRLITNDFNGPQAFGLAAFAGIIRRFIRIGLHRILVVVVPVAALDPIIGILTRKCVINAFLRSIGYDSTARLLRAIFIIIRAGRRTIPPGKDQRHADIGLYTAVVGDFNVTLGRMVWAEALLHIRVHITHGEGVGHRVGVGRQPRQGPAHGHRSRQGQGRHNGQPLGPAAQGTLAFIFLSVKHCSRLPPGSPWARWDQARCSDPCSCRRRSRRPWACWAGAWAGPRGWRRAAQRQKLR